MAKPTAIEAKKTVKEFLDGEEVQEQLGRALANNPSLSPERFARVAITTIFKDDKLANCTPQSLLQVMLQSAQMGLEPDGINAHLIAYGQTATLIIDYKGYIKLAYRSALVESIRGEVVYSKDDFEYAYGTNQTLKHVKALVGKRGDRIAAYSYVKFKDGGESFVVLREDEVALAKKSSKSANSSTSPWKTHPDAMWAKTAVRQHAKSLPMEDLKNAAILDEKMDMGIGDFAPSKKKELQKRLDNKDDPEKPEVPVNADDPKKKSNAPSTEELIEKIGALTTDDGCEKFWRDWVKNISHLLPEEEQVKVREAYALRVEEIQADNQEEVEQCN